MRKLLVLFLISIVFNAHASVKVSDNAFTGSKSEIFVTLSKGDFAKSISSFLDAVVPGAKSFIKPGTNREIGLDMTLSGNSPDEVIGELLNGLSLNACQYKGNVFVFSDDATLPKQLCNFSNSRTVQVVSNGNLAKTTGWLIPSLISENKVQSVNEVNSDAALTKVVSESSIEHSFNPNYVQINAGTVQDNLQHIAINELGYKDVKFKGISCDLKEPYSYQLELTGENKLERFEKYARQYMFVPTYHVPNLVIEVVYKGLSVCRK